VIGIVLLLLWCWSRREVLVLLVLLRGVVPLVTVGSRLVVFVVVVGSVIFVPLRLIAMIRIRLDHIYASLVGLFGWHSCLWCKRFMVWELLSLGGIHGFPYV
jgi:hypothetical protein